MQQVEVLTSQDKTVLHAIQSIGEKGGTFHRGLQEYGGLKGGQVKCLKELDASAY